MNARPLLTRRNLLAALMGPRPSAARESSREGCTPLRDRLNMLETTVTAGGGQATRDRNVSTPVSLKNSGNRDRARPPPPALPALPVARF